MEHGFFGIFFGLEVSLAQIYSALMEYGGYLIGLVLFLIGGGFLYRSRKRFKGCEGVLEFRPHTDASGDRIEFVVRKRGA